MKISPFPRARAALLAAAAVALTQVLPAGAAGRDYLAIQPTGIEDTLHLRWVEHSFGFYSGAPAEEFERRLPPGFELDSCLKHRVPGATLARGTADFVIEASAAHVHELGVTTGIGLVVTCVKPPPAALGYPQPVPADEGHSKLFGLPSAPSVFTIDMWLDEPTAVEHAQRYGMTAEHGDIDITHLGDAGWRATVGDDQGPLYEAAFPTMPRAADGGVPAGCVPYRQSGHVFEWEEGQTSIGVLSFTHFVEGPNGDPAQKTVPGQLCPTGGAFTWPADGRMAKLLGPPRPATLIGQQLEADGLYDHFALRRYRMHPANRSGVLR